jgi:hypothetical protein
VAAAAVDCFVVLCWANSCSRGCLLLTCSAVLWSRCVLCECQVLWSRLSKPCSALEQVFDMCVHVYRCWLWDPAGFKAACCCAGVASGCIPCQHVLMCE